MVRMIIDAPDLRSQIQSAGFAVAFDVISDAEIVRVISALDRLSVGTLATRGHNIYAARNLLSSVSELRALAMSSTMRELFEPILGPGAFAVRGILFDKVPGANWHVGWHQDQIIAVVERRVVPGFDAWSVKHGVTHVRPPASVLQRMLTLRIHLDDCGEQNGALRVIPKSHLRGLLGHDEIDELVREARPVVCEASRGTVLLMCPLLLHASSPAAAPTRRRVIHLEFAGEALPGDLAWAKS